MDGFSQFFIDAENKYKKQEISLTILDFQEIFMDFA
jgi:hypothetical protein